MPVFSAIAAGIGAIVSGVGAFIGGLGAIGTFALQMAAGIGVSYLAKALAGKPKKQDASNGVSGVQGKLQAAGDVPRQFMLGKGATAGSLVYANAWGNDGDTPNAYFTQVIALSDLPVKGLRGVWVNGEYVTLTTENPSLSSDSAIDIWKDAWAACIAAGLAPMFSDEGRAFVSNYIAAHTGQTPGTGGITDWGYPVLEYRKDGKDHLWIKFYDGTQTVADPFLTGRVSTTQRPYETTRVGKGIAYVICTSLVNDTLFTGFPQFLFELDGVKLYDPSKDDTNGGEGDQRYSDPATWGGDGDDLPAVQIYNLLRGIKYGDDWLYGFQNFSGRRAIAENWVAQANKCRALVEGPDGPEPTYRSAGQIAVDTPLGDTVEALLTSCQGKLSETGGFYKMHCGEPDSPSFFFTDDDILSTEEQSFTPFFGLADTVNGISGKYPSPEDGWAMKPAPPVLRTDLEARAGNRRLLSDVTFDFVPHAPQVQRLMNSALLAAQRARRHTFSFGPKFWFVEPGDVGAYTSQRNGYTDKLFEVNGAVDKANLDVTVDLTEVDPSDYVPPVYIPTTGGSTIITRPEPQGIVDWYAEPAIIKDSNGINRRPAIRLSWDGSLPGIIGVQYEVRLKIDASHVTRGRTDQIVAGAILVTQSLLPNVHYQVRGQYIPSSPRDMLWSDWIDATTPDVRLSVLDFEEYVNNLVTVRVGDALDSLSKQLQIIASSGSEQDAQQALDRLATRILLQKQGVTIKETAQIIEDVDGRVSGMVSLLIDNNGYVSGTIQNNDGTESSFTVLASEFFVVAPGVGDGEPIPLFLVQEVNGQAAVTINGDVMADGSITARALNVATLSAVSADFGDATFTGKASGGPTGLLEVNFTDGAITGYRNV